MFFTFLKLALVSLALFWIFIAFLIQMLIGGNYAPNLFVGAKLVTIFLLLSSPGIVYLSWWIYQRSFKGKISIFLIIAVGLFFASLVRSMVIVNSNIIKVGGSPAAIASVNDKMYVFDRGHDVYCGGFDPSCTRQVNPIIWVVDKQNFKLVKKLSIPNCDPYCGLGEHFFKYQNKLYYFINYYNPNNLQQGLLAIDPQTDSFQNLDLNQLTSTSLPEGLFVTSFDIDNQNELLYLLLTGTVWDPTASGGHGVYVELKKVVMIDLVTLSEKAVFDIKNDFAYYTSPSAQKLIFLGSDGKLRFLTTAWFHKVTGQTGPRVSIPSGGEDPFVDEFTITVFDPANGSFLEEFRTNVKAGSGPMIVDKNSDKIYLPSSNNYINYQFIEKIPEEISGIPVDNRTGDERTSQLGQLAIDGTHLYHGLRFKEQMKITILDKLVNTQSSAFEIDIKRPITFGTFDGLLYIAHGAKLEEYNRQGELLHEISLR